MQAGAEKLGVIEQWRAFPDVSRRSRYPKDEPRAVDEGFVIVEPDEVKTKAQPSTGRKEVWTYTAVVLVAGWIASTQVEKYNDWAVSARCKNQVMSWSPPGVLALAAMEATRRNGELDAWRRDRALPEHRLPESVRKAV